LLPVIPPALETLGLPAVVLELANLQHGLILFAGPTGCGKTTSLAALVDCINERQTRRIITIEDPIEYRHAYKRSSIVQREIPSDSASFEAALIGALRADPDVILVGEMRDVATMRAVLSAAETGHLVLTTLHTVDAPGTVDRLIDAFPGNEQAQVRSQVASTLQAVLCQQLVSLTGDRGRCCVAEVLVATDAVRAMIRDGRTHQLRNAMAIGRSSGMQTMEYHLARLLEAGDIDRAEALRACRRRDELDPREVVA
jgi:twitching motility protein PilT